MEKEIGIYGIINTSNNMLYIGQSIDIRRRIYIHKLHLKQNKHHNSYLQNVWNKYGEKNLEFRIIEKCNKEELNQKEVYYIKYYKSNMRKYGYNLDSGGNSDFPCEESKIKNRESQFSIPSLQVDFNGKIIKLWEHGARNASKELNLLQSSIWKCVNGKCKTAYGFIWITPDDYSSLNLFNRLNQKDQGIKVVQLDLYGNYVSTYNNISDVKNNGFDASAVVKCCKGKALKHKGFRWVYNDDYINNDYDIGYLYNSQYKPIVQLDNNYKFIKEWLSCKEVAEYIKCSPSMIKSICNETIAGHTFRNFIWYYKEDYLKSQVENPHDSLLLCSNE